MELILFTNLDPIQINQMQGKYTIHGSYGIKNGLRITFFEMRKKKSEQLFGFQLQAKNSFKKIRNSTSGTVEDCGVPISMMFPHVRAIRNKLYTPTSRAPLG